MTFAETEMTKRHPEQQSSQWFDWQSRGRRDRDRKRFIGGCVRMPLIVSTKHWVMPAFWIETMHGEPAHAELAHLPRSIGGPVLIGVGGGSLRLSLSSPKPRPRFADHLVPS
jgi:hypothetical protein